MPERLPTIDSDPENKDNNEPMLEEIAELEEPIKKIIMKIKERIEGGEYGLVIGDDASGRIPARIIGGFIRKVSEQRGMEKPNIIFIPGKLSISEAESISILEDHLEKYGATKDKKILIVTDTVKSGESLGALVQLIKKLGYGCEIATIGLEKPILGISDRLHNLRSTKIISGRFRNIDNGSHTPQIYRSNSRGVSKRTGYWVSNREENQSLVNESREDANILTDRLLEWYSNK